jgi:hypothetical protein
MHAIVIPKGNVFSKEPVKVCMDGYMDFSDRTLIERKLPDEKASYCFLVIMKYWCDKLTCGEWSDKKKGCLNITAKEVKRNDEIVATYRKFIAYMKKSFKKHWNITLTIKNTKVESMKNGAYIGPKYWATNGCYGHESFKSIIMSYMLRTIDKITEPNADLSILCVDDRWNSYLDFCDMASFILDPNAVILQNTDECDEKDLKKMQRMVMSYVRKNKGMCFVDWPFGG